MEESWRIRMGIPTAPPPTRHRTLPNYPPRSTGDLNSHRARKPISGDISDDPLSPEDFIDVFGGPPRTILSRKLSSTGFSRSLFSSQNFSYEDIFRPAGKTAGFVGRGGRSLPEFRIPGQSRRSTGYHHDQQHKRESDGFYADVFGCDHDERVSRSRPRSSKISSSKSVLSPADLSPLRHEISGDDHEHVFFASKLRPINVNSGWFSRRTKKHEDYQNTPPSSGAEPIYNAEKESFDNMEKYPFGLNTGRNTSPETISMEPMSNNSLQVSVDDLELNSPSPQHDSSVCQPLDREIKGEISGNDYDDDDDAMSSSYVIEINSDYKETACESNGVDEAIAWAKEKFQAHNLERMQECEKEKNTKNSSDLEQESQQIETKVPTEIHILDEKIKLWSTGKEGDIRLLLTTLHNILWPNSGWSVIPLWNIIEIPRVRKAYQKACLCLHPDKLQQRGATIPQKYVAQKAFAVLQDAWDTFISRDVLKNC